MKNINTERVKKVAIIVTIGIGLAIDPLVTIIIAIMSKYLFGDSKSE